ncbi:MAG: saccharopine dehydrogenase NADP-binding domain-containing protein, partial [Pseudomonadota bacterium]
MSNRDFDVVVYGASGFTGRLVAEYLGQTYGTSERWAMAGRSVDKLAAVRDEIGAPADIPLLAADASNPDALRALVKSTHCIATTVGPYQLYGSDLVQLCAEEGTHYVDLCGEPGWMHDMIAQHNVTAKASGARIVFSCGFDSIPFDLGVYFLQQQAIKQFAAPLSRVRGRVRAMVGEFSGGTAASLQATMAAVGERPELVAVLTNPFALADGFSG